jgi:hypothetical protein
MRKIFRFGCSSASALCIFALSACSSLIPPQVFPNTFGITGQQVQVQIGASAAIRTAAIGVGNINSSFPDIDTSSIPVAFNISQSLFKIGFSAETKLATSATSLPCSIILTRVDISVTLKDAQNTFNLPVFHVNKAVELDQQTDDLISYKITTDNVSVGNILNSTEVKQLQDIITTGGVNQAVIRVTVQSTSVPDLPPGSTLTFTFNLSEVTLAF